MTVHRRDISDREALEAATAYRFQVPHAGIVGVPPRRASTDNIASAYETLVAQYPPKVVLAKLEHLADRGLVEYGTSLLHVWPTEQGVEMLRALRAPE